MNNNVSGCDTLSLSVKIFISSLFCCYLFLSLFVGLNDKVETLTPIVYVSIGWFVSLFFMAGLSERYFWIISPIALLFTPNALNEIFPGSAMGPIDVDPTFSVLTHIDIYLFLGVVLFCDFKKKINWKYLAVLAFISVGFMFSLLLSVLNDVVVNYWIGSFQFRYLWLLFILFCFSNPDKYEKEFTVSLILALFLVLLEALFFSSIFMQSRLTSGNYGVNILGHMFAAIVLFLYFWILENKATNRFLAFFLMVVFFVAVIFTGTRFSILAVFGGLFIMLGVRHGRWLGKTLGLFFLLLFAFVFLTFIPLGASIREGVILVWQGVLSDQDVVVTADSSSIITRMILWSSTWNMFSEHWWSGVSPGAWAFLREKYGIPFDTVLDPHNELLNLLVSYGLFIGGGYFFVLYIIPFFYVLFSKAHMGYRSPWFAMLSVFFVAGLSNSITWKHQLAFLVAYTALSVIFHQKYNRGEFS